MAQLPIEDTTLGARALAYVIELHHELTAENGAPTLGSQNQAVEFICANPELSLAVTAWAKMADVDEASMVPRRRLPFDQLHEEVSAFLQSVMVPRLSY
jgi:hypothetical protein